MRVYAAENEGKPGRKGAVAWCVHIASISDTMSVLRAVPCCVSPPSQPHLNCPQLVSEGFYEFWNWFDSDSWYPLGRVVGGTVYPGIMVTAATVYKVREWAQHTCLFVLAHTIWLRQSTAQLVSQESARKGCGRLRCSVAGLQACWCQHSAPQSQVHTSTPVFLCVSSPTCSC
jgi:hypothetical protein